MSSKKVLVLLLLLLIFTRIFKLDWGEGYFFHPDENNMANAVSQLRPGYLDPHFYAYGQFPLYLGYFSLRSLNITNNFPNSVMVLRVYSALFAILSGVVFYLICKQLFKDLSLVYSALLLYIFNPGLIQLSKFGTTESLLILVFLSSILGAIKFYQQPENRYLIFSAIIIGFGLASKISAAIFVTPLLISVFLVAVKHKKYLMAVMRVLIVASTCLLIAACFSPYNFINWPEFINSMKYETQVASGQLKVFYTNQFANITPYIFQLTKIFPYSAGIFQYLFGILGFIVFVYSLVTKRINKEVKIWAIVLLPSLVYFIYFGQVYTGWSRFMSPIFYLPVLFSIFFLSSINHLLLLRLIVVVLSIVPGLTYLRTYTNTDVRITASRWIENNISTDANIISEAGNVINLPISSKQYRVENIDLYHLDDNPVIGNQLSSALNRADYIIIPSRRIFSNQNNNAFPKSQQYYSDLFSGKLGFRLIKTFSTDVDFLLNSENAEETWSVFDHPTIRIYSKI